MLHLTEERERALEPAAAEVAGLAVGICFSLAVGIGFGDRKDRARVRPGVGHHAVARGHLGQQRGSTLAPATTRTDVEHSLQRRLQGERGRDAFIAPALEQKLLLVWRDCLCHCHFGLC